MSWIGVVAGSVVAGALLLSASSAAGNVVDPRVTVQTTSDELIQVIDQGKSYFEADPERFYQQVQQVLDPAIDFEAFARGVMAVHYKRATDAQRARFTVSFKSSLVRTYAKALLAFSDEQIIVLPEDRPSKDPKKQTVKMEIRSAAGKIYPAVYSMRLYDDGKWRIRNIIINGINIGLTYRNQFASAMKSSENGGDMDKVIDSWGVTIADVEVDGADADT